MPPAPRLLTIAAAAALALPTLARAADDEATRLGRITVSASTSRVPDSESALPNTVTVITREELEQQLALTDDLSQILGNLVPAFSPARQKLTSSGESLRGRQPLYMIDGVPQSTPLRQGSREGHTIDPAMIERIEIIHGANALQGLGASGGIINIITKRAPEADGEFHEVTVRGSTGLPHRDDNLAWRGSYLYGWRGGDWDLIAGASYGKTGISYDGDGRPLYIENTQGDLMDSRQWDLFAKLGYTLADGGRLQLMANRYDVQGDGDYAAVPGDVANGIPASAVRGEQPGDPPQNRVDSVSLDLTLPELAGGAFQAQLFGLDFSALYGGGAFATFQDPNLPAPWFDQSRNVSKKIGAKTTWSRADIAGLPLRLTLGLDALRDKTYQELAQSGRLWVPETVYESISPLVQAEYWLGESVMLTGGVRYERGKLKVDDFTTLAFYGNTFVEGGEPDLSETLPNAGAVWYVTDALNVYASYAEGYTVADVGRVLRGINQPGFEVDQLVDLSPVIADNQEVGVDYDDGRVIAHLAYYESESDFGSLLIYDPVNNVYNVSRQPTAVRGVEASLAWAFRPDGKLGAGYARSNGRYDADRDGELDSDLGGNNIGPDRLNFFWDQNWGHGLASRVQLNRYFSREFETLGTQTAEFDAYHTLDLFASYAAPVGTLSLGLENLLDEQYITYHSQVVPDDEDYTAGRGRTLTLSWSHRF